MLVRRSVAGLLLALAGGSLYLAVPGCGTSTSPPGTTQPALAPEMGNQATSVAAPEAADEHAHAAGAHGGTIVAIGADSYHAEVVVEQSGTLRLLMLSS